MTELQEISEILELHIFNAWEYYYPDSLIYAISFPILVLWVIFAPMLVFSKGQPAKAKLWVTFIIFSSTSMWTVLLVLSYWFFRLKYFGEDGFDGEEHDFIDVYRYHPGIIITTGLSAASLILISFIWWMVYQCTGQKTTMTPIDEIYT